MCRCEMWNHLLFWRTFWNEGQFSPNGTQIDNFHVGSGLLFLYATILRQKEIRCPKHTREEGGPERKGASLNQPPCVLQLARARKE